MSAPKRDAMPDPYLVAEYWFEHQSDDSTFVLDLGSPACMACGWTPYLTAIEDTAVTARARWSETNSKLQRCHIVPHALGGSEDVSNLVMLCKKCHGESPDVSDPEFMIEWVKSRPSGRFTDVMGRAMLDNPEFVSLMTKYLDCGGDPAIVARYAGEYAGEDAVMHEGKFSAGTYVAAGLYGLRRALQEARANVWHDDLLALLDTEETAA
ncbi:HNH endonuclease signature motif containing protein [Rhodococcus qingshengii]|uniref:HNH endonuclease n=1 Tax=Rhodococcus TaxID=1827 RepID=UPI001E6218DD|nr:MULTISPECIES: HNH endonuclease signature motif containing protein [Rhodococcus]MCD2099630.1 HNH endonuclease [Rhodococcus rhodochrous]MCD2123998.1 HNH endonuclease [Rhodococcus rhodochrous]MCQ4136569.1 HNH endonuclease [Rhodococcus rhodochrous]MDJ0490645.1 HNH endonuclease signature motif containing protein [Rhodococcus qingshengii]